MRKCLHGKKKKDVLVAKERWRGDEEDVGKEATCCVADKALPEQRWSLFPFIPF
jgi:hypothetical protein